MNQTFSLIKILFRMSFTVPRKVYKVYSMHVWYVFIVWITSVSAECTMLGHHCLPENATTQGLHEYFRVPTKKYMYVAMLTTRNVRWHRHGLLRWMHVWPWFIQPIINFRRRIQYSLLLTHKSNPLSSAQGIHLQTETDMTLLHINTVHRIIMACVLATSCCISDKHR